MDFLFVISTWVSSDNFKFYEHKIGPLNVFWIFLGPDGTTILPQALSSLILLSRTFLHWRFAWSASAPLRGILRLHSQLLQAQLKGHSAGDPDEYMPFGSNSTPSIFYCTALTTVWHVYLLFVSFDLYVSSARTKGFSSLLTITCSVISTQWNWEDGWICTPYSKNVHFSRGRHDNQ